MKDKYITLDYKEYLAMEEKLDQARKIMFEILEDENVPEETKDWIRCMAKELGWWV